MSRLGYSRLLCTLPRIGNFREANLLSREEPDFLLAEIQHRQTEVISFVLLNGRGGSHALPGSKERVGDGVGGSIYKIFRLLYLPIMIVRHSLMQPV